MTQRPPVHSLLLSTTLVSTAVTLALSGCTNEPVTTPSLSPTAETCASAGTEPEAGGDPEAEALTAAALCALDGRSWSESAFTLVMDPPEWESRSEECDEARQNAWWTAWQDTQPAIVTFDLGGGEEGGPDGIGSVGVAVLEAADARSIVATIDDEVEACIDGGGQSRLTYGEWDGVHGPSASGDGDFATWTWWTAVEDRWAFVQSTNLRGTTEADLGELEAALETVLDAQRERLEAD
ncbi:hypothetical protein [Labedella endophytica]|uniref:DUF3558 domain-containing protein n=1 Tax=Labedella endophytica TaxID=1523160 RepID=A0A433JNY8_9MICO|nr:hypothetical protein [Labedella endophytica]RUQ97652.1 hypothetical protein ELQ94_15980 [Labedella endophytica]